MIKVRIEGGKYTVVQDVAGRLSVLRYNEPWMNDPGIPGSNMLITAACEIEASRRLLWELVNDFDPDKSMGPPCGPEMLEKIQAHFRDRGITTDDCLPSEESP